MHWKKILGGDGAMGALLAAAAFGVYSATRAPAVGSADCGELAAAFSTLGIAHPTGYPLLTLLGWGFTRLPFGGEAILKLNLLVGLLCSLAVYLFFRLFLFLQSAPALELFAFRGDPKPVRKGDRPSPPVGKALRTAAAATAALALAFSRTFWSEGVSLEVHALHLVFLPLVTWLFLRSLAAGPRVSGTRIDWGWCAFAFALGLSFTNHMMTVLLAPAFLVLYFAVHGFGRAAWVKIAKAAGPFAIGLLPYLYLPLRAARKPAVNWGDPSTLGRLWWHISGGQFRYRMFSSLEVPARKLPGFFAALPSEFGYAPLLLALLGLWILYRRSPRLLVFSALIFAVAVVYAINYDFEDPNYYLNAYAALAIGILWGARGLLGNARLRGWRAGALCAACVLCCLGLNWRSADESADYAVEEYARNALQPLAPGAILLSDQTETLLPGAEYLQQAEGFRPDVVVLSYRLMWFPWYYTELESRHPALVADLRPEIEAYDRDYQSDLDAGGEDFRVSSGSFARLVEALFRRNAGAHPLYITPEVKPEYAAGFQPAPEGLALRLNPGPDSLRPPAAGFSYHPLVKDDFYTGAVRDGYAGGYANQGIYAAMTGNREEGGRLLRKALEVKPGLPVALEWLRRLGAPP